MTNGLFDTMPQSPAYDGQPAKLVALTNAAGMQVVFMDIGATWLSCVVPVAGEMREVLLGLSTMDDFKQHGSFLGVTVGRYANRIGNSQYSYQGETYQLNGNQGAHCLHGGKDGWSHRRWDIVNQNKQKVEFSIFSADGDQGFPGNATASVTYELTDDNQVVISYQASTDKATPLNLTNHAYFNLLGAESGADILEHKLQVNADYYLPTTFEGIPLGELASVENTSFDFRTAKTVKQDLLTDEQQKNCQGYDHSFLLDDSCKTGQPVATVEAPDGALSMQVLTDKPAIQFYGGNFLAGTPNRKGSTYKQYQGLALETQYLPDSPNHTDWPQESCMTLPGEEYAFTTVYKFNVLAS
ncbi:MAG: galactose-1-epimerase [Vibrio sp.]|uniref:galactose-1-epimerase n=1 Tax=Vibrio sp. TaxID=678 RepID=UPI003A867EFD